jgi:hypothetical protein
LLTEDSLGQKSVSPAKTNAPGVTLDRIQPSEVRDVINAHPDGIKIADLLKKFDKRIDKDGHMTRSEWLQLVRQYGTWGTDKLLRPKTKPS